MSCYMQRNRRQPCQLMYETATVLSVRMAPKRQSTYRLCCSGGEQSWLVQKALRSDTSPPNSPGSLRDWQEMRGELPCLPTAISWLLARGGITDESEEAVCHTVSARKHENPKEREIALSMTMWLELNDSPCSSLRHCPRHLLRSSSFPHLRVAGGSALPQEARHAGLGDDLAWDRAALEDT